MIHIVCGAPCSGKSTYVLKRAKPGEIVIDTDRIAEAIGSGQAHQAGGAYLEAALKMRKTLIDYAKESKADAWIIHTKPSRAQMEEYKRIGADVVVLDPGIEVCKQRAETRPAGTIEAIEKWYNKKEITTAEQFADWFERVSEL